MVIELISELITLLVKPNCPCIGMRSHQGMQGDGAVLDEHESQSEFEQRQSAQAPSSQSQTQAQQTQSLTQVQAGAGVGASAWPPSQQQRMPMQRPPYTQSQSQQSQQQAQHTQQGQSQQAQFITPAGMQVVPGASAQSSTYVSRPEHSRHAHSVVSLTTSGMLID